jgi:autotransporter-associated beta strand protein
MTSRRLRNDSWANSGRRADVGQGRALAALPPNRDGGTTPFTRTCRCGRSHALRTALLASVLISVAVLARAQDATWLASPGSGDFNTATNWNPATVPTGTAFFGTSTQTNLSFSAHTTIGGWTFNPGASSYSFITSGRIVQFNGDGIVNGGSATITNNNTAGGVRFLGTSTAGNAAINNNLGTLEFFGASTAGSATISNNDLLQFADTGTAGSAIITNNTGAVTRFFGTSTAGTASITSNGTVQFFETSTAGTASIDNNGGAGVVQFSDTSTAGSATITINNGVGGLRFFGTSTAGTATIISNGTVQFRETSTAGSATIISNFSLQFSDASTAGSATITNNGFLEFRDASTAGGATITSDFSLRFFGTSSAGSATITNNDLLIFSDASTAGSATITNNSGLLFLQTSTGGTARFINGGGIDLSALSNAGMTAGSIEGAGFILLGSKNLAVGGNNLSTTFSGALQDGGNGGGVGGSLTKTGTGTLTLSSTSSYTGATTVDAGTLLVDGSIASSSLTTVNAGGTLGGSGTVGNTLINGGTLAPGTSIGTLTVSGSLVMTAASTYLVEVSPTNADRTNVTGTATLGGTVQAVFAPGSYVARTHTILTSADLGGSTFGGLTTSNLPAGFSASLSYTTTDAILNLTAALGAGSALNQNQQNVATAINSFFNNGGALPPNFVSVFGLTGGNLANTLSLLSGEAATGAQQGAFQLGGQFLGLMLDPFVDGRGGGAGAGGPALGFAPGREALPDDIALAYSKAMKAPVYKAAPVAFEQRWTAWGGAFGGYNRTNGDPVVTGSHDLTARAAGFAAGLDYHFSRDAVFGFALAGGGTKWDLAQGLGGGKSDAFQAGVYAAARSGPAYLAASLAFANHWMSTDRVAAFGNHLTADFNARSIGARVESGYRFSTPASGITPYAALQAQSFHTPTYSETDVNGGGFGLTYNTRTAHDIRSELGARFDHVALVDPSAVLTLRGRLAWAHDWVSDPSLAAVFQALPGASFIVNGAAPAKDSALASAGAELKLANGITLSGKFDGEFARRSSTYAGTGTVRVGW